MDVEPIYCAEQIVVPPDLADVLKAYTKEVIRKQPENILEFSARYFANLAAVRSGIRAVAAPSRPQLQQAYEQLRDTPAVPLADVLVSCQAAGISKDTVMRVVEAGRIPTSQPIAVLEVLLLLLTMGCESFAATVEGIFQVFGGSSSSQLEVPTLMQLLEYLGSRDSDVGLAVRQAVAATLAGQSHTTLKELKAIPALAGKLLG